MKKFNLMMIVMLLGIMVCASCTKSKLEQGVEAANAECPLSMGMMGEMTSMTLDGKYLLMVAEVNEDFLDLDALSANRGLMRANIKMMVQNADGEMAELVEQLKAEGYGMKIKYVGKTSGKTVTASLSAKELEAASEEEDDPTSMIEGQVRTLKAQLPMDAGNGITIVDAEYTGDYMVYICEVDESILNIATLQQNAEAVKQNMLASFRNTSDPSVAQLIKLCKKVNVGLGYQYVGEISGEEVFIAIECDEL